MNTLNFSVTLRNPWNQTSTTRQGIPDVFTFVFFCIEGGLTEGSLVTLKSKSVGVVIGLGLYISGQVSSSTDCNLTLLFVIGDRRHQMSTRGMV